MIIANSAIGLVYLFGAEDLRHKLPNIPDWGFFIFIVGAIFNLVCAIVLFKWKKWGFWGFLGSAVVIFFFNIFIGIGPGRALLGLLGVAILYGVLHIGKERKGWSQLD
jgi:hypothetical protein